MLIVHYTGHSVILKTDLENNKPIIPPNTINEKGEIELAPAGVVHNIPEDTGVAILNDAPSKNC